ncbi:MAG: glycosyltransferase family 2 protein [Bacteroidales bacterium]|nr:glycosyltransferase family 2 protein [Bacteroidales bacterium]
MKVSILVPIYGVEKYIEQCAVSLFEQSHEDIEYIFVNDCTPDGSIDVLRSVIARYPQRQGQVRIIDHEVNRGLGAARHTATAAATGEVVMHVDSDDYLMPHAVEHLCAKMKASGADIVDGGYVTVTAGKESPLHAPFHGSNVTYLKLMLCQNIVFNRIWGRLYRRSLFTQGGINSVEGINYGEDYVVVPRLLLGAKRACLDEAVYAYRDDNATSYTHSINEKHNRSFYRAHALVHQHFTAHDTAGTYATALQMAMLAMVRHARRYEGHFRNLDALCPIKVKGIAPRLCNALLRSRLIPFPIANFIYLATRRLYKEWLCKKS